MLARSQHHSSAWLCCIIRRPSLRFRSGPFNIVEHPASRTLISFIPMTSALPFQSRTFDHCPPQAATIFFPGPSMLLHLPVSTSWVLLWLLEFHSTTKAAIQSQPPNVDIGPTRAKRKPMTML
ncbi:hypothetical protein N656DRAFT_81617 [Canariomyces notabilis]|uniref:Uncharacterized protein n=1 Tax=Canariomyces notabilis TaxID=2074819 RepID=A0AAN6TEF1_9PEZI|nr:hypothetical protein N656DRAFT_81617 [Canariomyces arenarius]